MFPWNMMFPFNKDMKNMMKEMKPNEVEGYVENIMSKIFPGQGQSMFNPGDMMKQMNMNPFLQPNGAGGSSTARSANEIHADVFETFEDVFVRIPVKDEGNISQLRVYHTTNQAIVENIPNPGERHVITLPALVRKKGSYAQYKDGILEIKIPKSIDMQFTEVDVSEKA
ncbi:Hsp20/alpha crystallin family protein [Falsibacillus pallidus]|uniref:HSP20 family molecular chaperone IbpA n=1 Tax=Falsibacillus pallidus TaxID=493781 RepID=A0A370GMP4_9BACI|nr:Hsp20/alpha crystallin family protein [Falsibacillus pallidus]RDI43173.1 HSP20 family molecular chaperone IbpA [Falsibacillus pallidus]